MLTAAITCPHCGFSKDVPQARLPRKSASVTCPKCRQIFPFTPGADQNTGPLAAASPVSAPAQGAAPPLSTPARATPSLPERPVGEGGRKATALLLFFLLLVIALVVVRLWADGQARKVPFPNFITSSKERVAVSWGQEIYLLDHAGRLVRKEALPQGVLLTQLLYVGDDLWFGSYDSKSVHRLRNGRVETVLSDAGRIRGTFKFAVDQNAGEIFLADSSNHRIHAYSLDGRYLRSFGREGKDPGALKFPNSIVFDGNGDLLVANTNAHRLDVFSRQGQFLRTHAVVKGLDRRYLFPTLFTQVGDKVAMLLTVDLRRAKVVAYGNDGRFLGELRPPRSIEESGDIASFNGKVLVTDNKERKVYRFDGETLAYQGPFSAELDTIGAQANAAASTYAKISLGALLALVASCVPIFIIFFRIRRQQQSRFEQTDYARFIPASALWSSHTDRKKMVLAVLVVILLQIALLWGLGCYKQNPVLALALFMVSLAMALIYPRLMYASGYTSVSRRKVAETLIKSVTETFPSLLHPAENVLACTVLQRNSHLRQPSMLLLTDRRVIVIDWTGGLSRRYSQLGYGDINSVALENEKQRSWLLRPFLPIFYRLTLTLLPETGPGSLHFLAEDRELLERLLREIEAHRGSDSPHGYAALCEKCFRPLQGGVCPSCTVTQKADWKPLILSLIYPGLGQFYNRQIGRGAFFSIFFTFGMLPLVRPLTLMWDRSAEFTSMDVVIVGASLLQMLVVYIISAADADYVGRKKRHLFTRDNYRRLLQRIRREPRPG